MSARPLAVIWGAGADGTMGLMDGSLLYRMQSGGRDGRRTHSGHCDS